jgi:hypothetical protein
MNIREGVRTSRRHQLRLGEPLASDLETFAQSRGLGICPAIRLLLREGLNARTWTPRAQDSPAALAGLLACEHALLAVASVLPDGKRRISELGPEAAAAAEQRLALFTGEVER